MKWFFIYVLAFALFYILELSIPSKKLDRYILPSLAMFSFLASQGILFISDKLSKKYKKLFLSGVVLFYGLTNFSLHPNYFAYYSPLLGGLKKGMYAIEPKWMVGQKEVAEHFSTNPRYAAYVRFPEDMSLDSQLYKSNFNEKLTIAFKEKYYTQVWPFIHEIGARATIKDLTPQAIRTNFFVYPVYDDDSSSEDRFDLVKVDTIKVDGVDIYNVYQRVEE